MIGFGSHKHFAGIDPGHFGAVAVLSQSGSWAKMWKMPWKDGEYDLDGLKKIFLYLKLLPDCVVGIEWPVAFPDSFANVARDAENFGRGKGYLEAFAFLMGLEYRRISPQLWKGRLGIPGKTHAGANERAAEKLVSLLPQHASMIRGPRGGLLDGPLDALLIAEACRSEILSHKFSAFSALGKATKRLTRGDS